MNTLLEEAISLSAIPDTIELNVIPSADLPPVITGPLLIDVFIELVSNAVKAMPHGGRLEISPTDENNRDGMILLEDLAAIKIPAIVVTGYGTAELARRAFRDYGTLDFLEKKDLELGRLRQVVKEAFHKAEEMEKELSELRAKFLRGEIVTLPHDRLERALREKPEEYGKQ